MRFKVKNTLFSTYYRLLLLLYAPPFWNTSIFTKLMVLRSKACSDWPAIQCIVIGRNTSSTRRKCYAPQRFVMPCPSLPDWAGSWAGSLPIGWFRIWLCWWILVWAGVQFVTRLFWGTIDFHSRKEILWKSMVPQNCSVYHILQNIFRCVQQNKHIHTGLKLLEGEQAMTEF